MQLLRPGKWLYLGLALLASSCRNSVPPKIEICIGDGFGGADCVEADGSKIYRAPSQLNNYWMTNQSDQANFASWCYDATRVQVDQGMNRVRETVSK